jgi:hypothetical protein
MQMEQVFTELFHQTFYTRLVKVTPKPGEGFDNLLIEWPAVTGAVAYNVYGAPTPFTKNLITLTPVPAPLTNLTYTAPHAPEDIVWHFWVKWINGAQQETLIEDDGATVYTNVDKFDPPTYTPHNSPQTTDYGRYALPQVMMPFYKDEIRRRHQTILNNDAEDFDVFLRRWSGKACPKQDARLAGDPDYDSTMNCDLCWGTGILGGYWTQFRIRARYNEMPYRTSVYTDKGIEFSEDFNSWTLWLPKLHEHDLLVRVSNNQRFLVVNVAESNWRTQPLRQAFRMVSLQPGDRRNLVSDTAITAALTHSGDAYERPSIWG